MWPFGSSGSGSGSATHSHHHDTDAEYHEALRSIVAGCSNSNHTEYLSHGPDTWIVLQEAHDRVKGQYARDWHSGGFSRASKQQRIPHSGMKIPFSVEVNPSTGLRQIRATRDIPAGFTVWEPIHYETFRSEHAYVEFLEELPHQYLRCEVLSWTHSSWLNRERFVDLTLDEGAFLQDSTDEGEINIDAECVSTRLIRAGEFIAMNHTDFYPPPLMAETESSAMSSSSSSSKALPHPESGVEWFDDLRSTAWQRTGLGMGSRRTVASTATSTTMQQHDASIAPGVVVLSALYAMTKLLRGSTKTKNTENLHNYYYNDDNDDRNFGMSFFYAKKKPKIA